MPDRHQLIDMTDRRIGHLVVTGRARNWRSGAYWHCRCDCGGSTTVAGGKLRQAEREGLQPQCKECRQKRPGAARGTQPINMTGKRVGCLVVLGKAQSRRVHGGARWRARCDCGAVSEFDGFTLRQMARRGGYRTCPACRHERRNRRVCSQCGQPGHQRDHCLQNGGPSHRKSKWCGLCGSLPHRVQGLRCRECGLRYQDDRGPSLEEIVERRKEGRVV